MAAAARRRGTPPLRHRRQALPLEGGGPYRLAVVADTHGRCHPAALESIAAQRPAYILHAGDIGDLTILDDLEELAPTIAVRGNVDGRDSGLHDIVTLALTTESGGKLTILLTHIGIARTKLRSEIRKLAWAQDADLVVCGHSHIPWLGTDGGLVVFNPGSIGPRRFALPITFGVIDVAPEGVNLSHLDCERGGIAWRPS